VTEIVSPEVLPELQPMLIAARAMPPIDYSQPFDEIRALAAAGADAFRLFFEPVPEMDEVYDTEIGANAPERSGGANGASITLRVYRPSADKDLPCLVYFHGGGWVLGDLDGSDPSCKKIAEAAGTVVVSVDYRLAPEHPHPIPMEDCYAAVLWTHAHADELGIDADDISIGGQSAGGQLAAVVALLLRDRRGPAVRAQWLDVPGVDLTLTPSESLTAYGEGFGLNTSDVEKVIAMYVPDGNLTDPYVSPVYADDLSGLPPAVVTIAGCDPLRDMGAAYAEKLEAAGVPVRLSCWQGHLHATQGLTALTPTAYDFIAEVAAGLREARELAPSR
jgi:acetyl esterase